MTSSHEIHERPLDSGNPGLLRRSLDQLYLFGGLLGGFFLVLILLIIVSQMLARWVGLVIPGSTAYAGYFMATSSFCALAYSLNKGAHIRVNLLLSALGRYRRYGEIWCFTLATFLSGYFAWYACKSVWISYLLKDISQGQDATPIWIPQLAMAFGTVLLFIAMLDNAISQIWLGNNHIKSEDLSESIEEPSDGR